MKELLLSLSLGTTLYNGKTCPFIDFNDVSHYYGDAIVAAEAIQPWVLEGQLDVIVLDEDSEDEGTYIILV